MSTRRPVPPLLFTMIYDLRDEEAWRKAHRDRSLWGKIYTDIHVLDNDHIILSFRSGGERWWKWEKVRQAWILGEGKAA
jgi:hypothetical protein